VSFQERSPLVIPGASVHNYFWMGGSFGGGENHAIDVRFQDKTALHFSIDPGFILETEYADLKTGNWRPIKRWPLIHSETHRIKR
jgi:hypothetical protein